MDVVGDIRYGKAMRPSSEAAALACSLFTRHRGRIYRLCLHNLRSTHDAEDALQQTFLNALQAIRSGVTPRAEAAWLLQIARNVCLERQRNAGRRARIEFIASPDSLADVASAQADDDGSDLAAALGRLDPRHREALVLREWRGLSYREIATVLQLSQSAVEALLFRARRSLARTLEDTRRLRPTFNWGSLFASCRTAFSGAAAKTAAIAACCGIAVVGVPVLENTALHRDGRPVGRSPLPSSSPAAAPSGVAATQTLERRRRDAIRRQRPGDAAATAGGSAAPALGVGSGATSDAGGVSGSGSGAPTTDLGGRPGAVVGTSASGMTSARAERPPAGAAGVSAQVSAGGISAQVSAGDTGVSADVAVDTGGADAAVQVDVSPPVLGGDVPSVGSPDVSVGADVGVSAGASDAGAVTADARVTVDTGQAGAVSVDLGVNLSLPLSGS